MSTSTTQAEQTNLNKDITKVDGGQYKHYPEVRPTLFAKPDEDSCALNALVNKCTKDSVIHDVEKFCTKCRSNPAAQITLINAIHKNVLEGSTYVDTFSLSIAKMYESLKKSPDCVIMQTFLEKVKEAMHIMRHWHENSKEYSEEMAEAKSRYAKNTFLLFSHLVKTNAFSFKFAAAVVGEITKYQHQDLPFFVSIKMAEIVYNRLEPNAFSLGLNAYLDPLIHKTLPNQMLWFLWTNFKMTWQDNKSSQDSSVHLSSFPSASASASACSSSSSSSSEASNAAIVTAPHLLGGRGC